MMFTSGCDCAILPNLGEFFRGSLGVLQASELKGYRALWDYLAGSAAYMASSEGEGNLQQKAVEHFTRAKRSAKNIPWLVTLSKYSDSSDIDLVAEENNALIMKQVEGIESFLTSVGRMHDRKYVEKERIVREGLNSKDNFEEAHRLLGEFLGFESRKIEDDASPDPWWQIGNLYFVFEDHANAENDILSPTKARQVSTHPNWMRENVESCRATNVEIIPVLISPVSKTTTGAVPHLNEVKLWKLTDFKEWASTVLDTIRDLRGSFPQAGDYAWRAEAASRLIAANVDVISIKKYLENSRCREALDLV